MDNLLFSNDTAVMCSIPIVLLLISVPILVYMENINRRVSQLFSLIKKYNFMIVIFFNEVDIIPYGSVEGSQNLPSLFFNKFRPKLEILTSNWEFELQT